MQKDHRIHWFLQHGIGAVCALVTTLTILWVAARNSDLPKGPVLPPVEMRGPSELAQMVCLVEVPDVGRGSGFFVQDARTQQVFVWTAAHVVGDKVDVLVKCDAVGVPFRRFVSRAKVVRTFEQEDIALLLVETPGTLAGWRKASLAESDPALGADVQHVGCFYGEVGSLSYVRGMVSKVDRPDPMNTPFPRFQTTAPVYPGSSGGPMFNASGEVCGIVVSRIGSDANFSVPVSVLRSVCLRAGITL